MRRLQLAKAVRYPASVLLAVLLIPVILWIQPLFLSHSIPRFDYEIHLQWSTQFAQALREGWLIPRWAAASHQGLGDPTFVYYQPLLYYVSGALAMLGMSGSHPLLAASVLPYILLGLNVAEMSASQSARQPSIARRVAAIGLVVTSPVLFFLSTSGAALPSVMAMPFCLLFALQSTRDRPDIVMTALWLCLVCLSHVLTGMMVLMCCGLGRILFAFPAKKTLPGHFAWIAGVALGMVLASYYLVPALTQLSLINPGGWTSGINFDWRRSFAFPSFTYLDYGLHWFAMQVPLPLLALVCALFVLIAARASTTFATDTSGQLKRQTTIRLSIISLCALVFASELAYPLYQTLTPLHKLQWPYRFVGVAGILSSCALARLLFLSPRSGQQPRSFYAGATICVVMQVCLVALLQTQMVKTGKPLPLVSEVMSGDFGQPEYLPAVRGQHWASYNSQGGFAQECLRLAVQCDPVVRQTHFFSAIMTAATATALRLPVFAFPAWVLSVDGIEQPLLPDADTGLPVVNLPAGRHAIELNWRDLSVDRIGRFISVFGILLVVLLKTANRNKRRSGFRAAALVTPVALDESKALCYAASKAGR